MRGLCGRQRQLRQDHRRPAQVFRAAHRYVHLPLRRDAGRLRLARCRYDPDARGRLFADHEREKQLQSDDYSRMLVYLNLPVGGDEDLQLPDQIRAVARSYYPDGDVYVVGDSSSEQDFKASFSRDNVVVSVLSILIVLVVLLFTFKSAGIPVLLILVIQGSIWINYGIPTITNSPLFFLSYLVVSSIQMGANIDYAIVTTSRFMEFKDKMPKRTPSSRP
ncbi:MAG: MMPL family transporter [Oscillospiraceae bacterium]